MSTGSDRSKAKGNELWPRDSWNSGKRVPLGKQTRIKTLEDPWNFGNPVTTIAGRKRQGMLGLIRRILSGTIGRNGMASIRTMQHLFNTNQDCTLLWAKERGKTVSPLAESHRRSPASTIYRSLCLQQNVSVVLCVLRTTNCLWRHGHIRAPRLAAPVEG